MPIQQLLQYYQNSGQQATQSKEQGYEVAKIWYAEQAIGFISLKDHNKIQIHTIFPEIERRYSIQSPVTEQFFVDIFTERSRVLFQYVLSLVLKSGTLTLTFDSKFSTFILELLVQSPRPLYDRMGQIIGSPGIKLEEYEKSYYISSIERKKASLMVPENEVKAILRSWLPELKEGHLLDFMTYLFPINNIPHRERFISDPKRMWYFIFAWILYYKFQYRLAGLYEDISDTQIDDLEGFLRGEDNPESPVRHLVYDSLVSKTDSEEDKEAKYQEAVMKIGEYYQKLVKSSKN